MKRDCWDLANAVLPVADRVLLYGEMTGSGKTTAGQTVGVSNPNDVYNVYLTEYTPMHELRGTVQPVLVNGQKVFAFADGVGLAPYRNGGRLVINELADASDDCMTFLLALLDDRAVSQIRVPLIDPQTGNQTGLEIVRPHKDFTVVATMNNELTDLRPALRDRFPVAIHIDKPNPQAVNFLPADLQKHAAATSILEKERRVGIRQWMAYAQLREEIDSVMAMEACFGAQADEILNAMTMSDEREYSGFRS